MRTGGVGMSATDPGPVPDDTPDVPPLTLRARIANALERHVDPSGATESFDEMVDAIHAEVSAGADYSDRLENTEMRAAQALAYLLDLPEQDRLNRLGQLIDSARNGSRCWEMNHRGQIEQHDHTRQQNQRYWAALTEIGKLTAPLDNPLAERVSTLAAEALVPE